jgi:hypothetical protein
VPKTDSPERHKSVLGKFCFPSLLVHVFWFASKLAAATPFLPHNVELISGWPLPLTVAERRGWLHAGLTGGHKA